MSAEDDALRQTYEFLRLRKAAFHGLGEAARADLKRFCRANTSCAVVGDHDRTMILTGRREVWLRIQEHLENTPEDLAVLYGAAALQKESKTDE